MDLLRLLTVKTLSLSLILIPVSGTARAGEVERSPLYYQVKKGDALSEVLDHLLLRPIYPVTGSLRRTIAANPGRFKDLNAPLFAGEKIYFAMSDEIMLRQNNEVLRSGEVRIGHRPTEERLTPTQPVAPLAKVQPTRSEPKIATKSEIPQELKKAAVEAAVLQAALPIAQRQEPAEDAERDPEDMPAPAAVKAAAAPMAAPLETKVQSSQTFPAKEDEEGVVKDAFVIEHSGERSQPSAATSYHPPSPLFPVESRKPARHPASQTNDEPLERDNYFPMGESPVSAPRPSDTKSYQSDF